jgi:tetratricopeptide repeat protein
MIRPTSLALAFALASAPGVVDAGGPKPQSPPRPPEQQEADRHFKNGVARYKDGRFAEALEEFQQAYEISPHPLVLYNIAGCYRELSRYGEAVKLYTRFLAEGPGKVPPSRISDAQTELNGIYALVARVTVKVEPADGASLFLDGNSLGALPLEMPLIMSPGDHKLRARAAGRNDVERDVRVAAGDDLGVELSFPAAVSDPGGSTGSTTGPGGPVRRPSDVTVRAPVAPPVQGASKRFAVNAAFATNALRAAAADTGTASVGLRLALVSGLELGVDATLVAYSVIPSLRLRIAGDALSFHAIAAAPISFNDGSEMETFVAGAVGLGLRLRIPSLPSLALHLESYAAFAGGGHGTTVPTFLGGELWF